LKDMGADTPFTNTLTAEQPAIGVEPVQLPGKPGLPRLVPVRETTIPGAMGPAVIEAAFITEAAVNAGACACAESASTEKEIVMPINVVRNIYSISDKVMSKSIFQCSEPLCAP